MTEIYVKHSRQVESVTLTVSFQEALYLHAVLGNKNQNAIVGTPYDEETVYEALDNALDRNGITTAERRKYQQDVKNWPFHKS